MNIVTFKAGTSLTELLLHEEISLRDLALLARSCDEPIEYKTSAMEIHESFIPLTFRLDGDIPDRPQPFKAPKKRKQNKADKRRGFNLNQY